MPFLTVESTISGRTITAEDPVELLEKINNIEPANDREEKFLAYIARACQRAITMTEYILASSNN